MNNFLKNKKEFILFLFIFFLLSIGHFSMAANPDTITGTAQLGCDNIIIPCTSLNTDVEFDASSHCPTCGVTIDQTTVTGKIFNFQLGGTEPIDLPPPSNDGWPYLQHDGNGKIYGQIWTYGGGLLSFGTSPTDPILGLTFTPSGSDAALSGIGWSATKGLVSFNCAANPVPPTSCLNGALVTTDWKMPSGGCSPQPVCDSTTNGISSSIAPTENLCSSGTASDVTSPNDNWEWECSNSCGSVNCSAPINPACGSAAGVSSLLAPTENLCSPESISSAVTKPEAGNWVWSCSVGSEQVDCSTAEIPFDFSLTGPAADLTVSPGDSVTTEINVNNIAPGSTPSSVSFEASSTESSITFSLPTSCTPDCFSTLTISTTPDTPISTESPYLITVTGTSGTLIKTTQFNLVVKKSPILEMIISQDGACGAADDDSFESLESDPSLCGNGALSGFESTGSGWTWTCQGIGDGKDTYCSAALSGIEVEIIQKKKELPLPGIEEEITKEIPEGPTEGLEAPEGLTVTTPGEEGGGTSESVNQVNQVLNAEIIQNISNFVGNILGEQVSAGVAALLNGVSNSLLTIADFLNQPLPKNILNIVTPLGAAAGALAGAAAALFLNPLAFKDLLLLPVRLWGSILTFLGIRKRAHIWGVVYDAITKQPLDPAVVLLQDQKGNDVTDAITDLDGRYGFLVEPGIYTLVANKTDYKFPSDKLKGRHFDELYQDLYFGGPIEAKEAGAVIAENIPLDPLKFNWNEFAKNEQKLMKFYSRRDLWIARISNAFYIIGFIVAIIAMMSVPRPFNFIIVGFYLLVYLLRRTHVLKPKPHGALIDKQTNLPIPFAIVRVFSAVTNTQIIQKVANKIGKYLILAPNGNYYVKIDRKNPDESYTTIHQSEVFEVKKGTIDRKFII